MSSTTPQSSDQIDFSDESLASIRRRDESLREFEIKSRAQQLRNVPTLDEEVRMALRFYQEPITLFGEGPGERRERLKLLMARMDLDGVLVRPPQFTTQHHHLFLQQQQQQQKMHVSVAMDEEEEEEEEGEQTELFFTEGPMQLKAARMFLAQYSLSRASQRIQQQKMLHALSVQKAAQMVREGIDPQQQQQQQQHSNDADSSSYSFARDIENKSTLIGNLKKFSTLSTQLSGDNRPMSCIAVSRGVALTTSWSGGVRLWNLKDSRALRTYRAHDERATSCCFHPNVDISPLFEESEETESGSTDVEMMDADSNGDVAAGSVAFASGGADNVAKLWSLQDTRKPLQELRGHTGRLSKMAFHPSGRFLGTASFDGTWRLWDVEVGGECLVQQEGHSSEVYSIVFQNDGALSASCDLGGIGRVWDLRTGRTVVVLKGHARKVLGLDWHPNGFQLASSSDDNTIRIWDVRRMGQCVYTIPAHNKLVSHVKFEPVFGRYLVSSSYDHTCKIWSTLEYRLIKTLRGHENLVFCTDIYKPSSDTITNPYSLDVNDAAENDVIVSCSYDRTWCTYSVDPLALDDLL